MRLTPVRGLDANETIHAPQCDQHNSEELRGDPEIVARALTYEPASMGFASMELRSSKEFLLEVIRDKDCGYSLLLANPLLQEDRELVLAALEATDSPGVELLRQLQPEVSSLIDHVCNSLASPASTPPATTPTADPADLADPATPISWPRTETCAWRRCGRTVLRWSVVLRSSTTLILLLQLWRVTGVPSVLPVRGCAIIMRLSLLRFPTTDSH